MLRTTVGKHYFALIMVFASNNRVYYFSFCFSAPLLHYYFYKVNILLFSKLRCIDMTRERIIDQRTQQYCAQTGEEDVRMMGRGSNDHKELEREYCSAQSPFYLQTSPCSLYRSPCM